MKIEKIKLTNYKSFQNLELDQLPAMAIFIGANGSGKSTFFDVFAFLGEALQGNIRTAIANRGGFQEVKSRDSEGPIQIELKFRLQISNRNRLVTYILKIGEESGKPIILKELLRYKRGRHGKPYHFLDFSRGTGTAITNEEDFDKKDEELDREEQKLGSPDILAIKGLGQFDRFKAANAFRNFIENWHVSDFHISDARPSQDAGYAEHLSPRGENLALVAEYMFENHRSIFDEVLQKMEQRVPGIKKVEAKITEDGRIVLRFQDGSFKDPFIARYVSDGTIKMFAYLLMLHDPNPHPLLCIEEPENQLYPALMAELYEEFKAYTENGGQVFITTHSPDLINSAHMDELFWLKKENGYTKAFRASEDPYVKAQFEAGNPMGYLWKSKMLQGIDP